MAGEWLKMEACTPDKAEVLAITAKMGWDDTDLTVGKLFRIWRWYDQHTTDGNAVGVTSALLNRIAGVTGFCEAMQSVGWLVINPDGISLPNFDRHNGNTAKKRALTAKRVSEHKSNAQANATGNAPSVTSALPREEKKRDREEESVTDVTLSACESPPAGPTMAAAVCVALRAEGMQSVNPTHPDLLKLIEGGATVDLFVHAYRGLKESGRGDKPFAYVIATVRGQIRDAQAMAGSAATQTSAGVARPATFREIDEQRARARWLEATGKAPAAPSAGFVIDVTPNTQILEHGQ